MIIVNFKNYVYGKKALDLAKKIKKISSKIIVAVSPVDVRGIEYYTKLNVFSQNVDFSKEKNKSTGFINIENLKEANAKGSLLNHSEHRINEKTIKETIKKSKKLNFKIILCVKNINEAKKYKKLSPWGMAYEDPKLIATKKSITDYKEDDIKKFINILKKTKIIPICGAGISKKEDYKKAIELGCKGVLVSSVVANSKNPDKFLKGIIWKKRK